MKSACAFLIIYLSLGFVQSQWAIEDDGCRTPDRGVGTCIAIRDCEAITTFLQQASRPLTQATIATLQSYQCGFEGNSPKVCCPANGLPTPRPSGDQSPPDVSNHPNLNLLPTPINCGFFENLADKIINGNKTDLFSFPWMTLLSYQTATGLDFRCGGTLINPNYILTAAHCISNLGTLQLRGVRLGEHNINSPVDCVLAPGGVEVCAPPFQDLEIGEVFPHPQYNATTYSNDIGLIRLATPANITAENVKPVCLPIETKFRLYDFNNKNVTVTGWGATESGQKSPELLQVDIPVIDTNRCRQIYAQVAPVSFRQICAGGKNRRDSCGGDSGGPLHIFEVVNGDPIYVQQGIVSYGPRFCGQEGFPGVYTKVAYYMDWILNTMSS